MLITSLTLKNPNVKKSNYMKYSNNREKRLRKNVQKE